MYGRLLLKGVHKPIDQFTQNDINSKRLFYQSQTADLGTWSQTDFFSFIVFEELELNEDVKRNKEEEFRFKTTISYSNIPYKLLNNFVPRNNVVVEKGRQ